MEVNMKKSIFIKLFAILCILCMSLAICACGGGNQSETPNTHEHTHSYVNGQCECGEFDPDFDPFASDEDNKPDDSNKNTVTYTVTVVDQNGAPVAETPVQLCVGDICLTPRLTDANGVVVFNIEPADYSVKLPLYSGLVFYFDGDSTELTITLTV